MEPSNNVTPHNMSLKPILLHGHAGGPNPWKVVLLLKELNIPYEHKLWDFPDLKKPEYEKLCPNGRTPTIEDPNTGITLWESGAILEYLIEEYDKENKFTYTSSPEKYQLKQWLHFQVSGQGPYFGQRVWFNIYHADKIPSAIDRYSKEIKRVLTVLDKHLKDQGTDYLVGDKYTYADLAFIPWNLLLPFIFGEESEAFHAEVKKELPTYHAWFERIMARPASQEMKKEREKNFEKKE
ncbi:putative glutathione S-transferase [Aureobasidium pullulans]|nr:putative glutathione S-transferase [Aureobasidium pullulans]THW87094.1 putative glutathione S-transferase [Aureobasidium pullulans]THY89261.1 putative glutathione S-transferase [Aureobasidium pullulans]TIA33842.1 putative glutathione S-transferase [Aureobasidium pullulans]